MQEDGGDVWVPRKVATNYMVLYPSKRSHSGGPVSRENIFSHLNQRREAGDSSGNSISFL
jgi:hypothetical protein